MWIGWPLCLQVAMARRACLVRDLRYHRNRRRDLGWRGRNRRRTAGSGRGYQWWRSGLTCLGRRSPRWPSRLRRLQRIGSFSSVCRIWRTEAGSRWGKHILAWGRRWSSEAQIPGRSVGSILGRDCIGARRCRSPCRLWLLRPSPGFLPAKWDRSSTITENFSAKLTSDQNSRATTSRPFSA